MELFVSMVGPVLRLESMTPPGSRHKNRQLLPLKKKKKDLGKSCLDNRSGNILSTMATCCRTGHSTNWGCFITFVPPKPGDVKALSSMQLHISSSLCWGNNNKAFLINSTAILTPGYLPGNSEGKVKALIIWELKQCLFYYLHDGTSCSADGFVSLTLTELFFQLCSNPSARVIILLSQRK